MNGLTVSTKQYTDSRYLKNKLRVSFCVRLSSYNERWKNIVSLDWCTQIFVQEVITKCSNGLILVDDHALISKTEYETHPTNSKLFNSPLPTKSTGQTCLYFGTKYLRTNSLPCPLACWSSCGMTAHFEILCILRLIRKVVTQLDVSRPSHMWQLKPQDRFGCRTQMTLLFRTFHRLSCSDQHF